MNVSRDTLWRGDIVLWQPGRGRGYRFNLDPVLLAGFAAPARHVLDLGAGCGVLGVLLLKLNKAEQVTAVEIQPELATLAERNAVDNGLADRLRVVTGDLRQVSLPQVDAVVFNPPYVPAGRGNTPPESGRARARHEQAGGLADFVAAATRALTGDSLCAILPAPRRDELVRALEPFGFAPSRQRPVVPHAGKPAQRMLVEARRGPVQLTMLPPLVVHAPPGRFSEEVRSLLRE